MATYSIYFRANDLGLTPTFVKFVNRTTGGALTPPAITEVTGTFGSFGEYKFTYSPAVDVSFTVDGGASIPSDNDRYVRGVLTPEDEMVDAAISSRESASDFATFKGNYSNARAALLDNLTRLDATVSSRATPADLNANGIAELVKFSTGRWKIHVTGSDTGRLVIYDTDGTTPLAKFDLKDANGNQTFVNPFERVPVP